MVTLHPLRAWCPSDHCEPNEKPEWCFRVIPQSRHRQSLIFLKPAQPGGLVFSVSKFLTEELRSRAENGGGGGWGDAEFSRPFGARFSWQNRESRRQNSLSPVMYRRDNSLRDILVVHIPDTSDSSQPSTFPCSPCWWTVNKRSLISSLCLSTSICSFHHCYLCLPRLHENHL